MAKAATKSGTVNTPSLTMFAPSEPGVLKEAIENSGASRSQGLLMVPIDGLRVAPGFNVRATTSPAYLEKIARISRSIIAEGFYLDKPLTGYVGVDSDGKSVIYVRDGHGRLEAAKMAAANGHEVAALPVIISKDTDPANILASLDKSNSGEKLSVVERAIIVKRMLNAKWTDDDIIAKLDISMQHLRDLVVLINSPKSIRNFVSADKISASAAIALIKKCNRGDADPDGKVAERAIKDMVEKADARGAEKATKVDSDEGTKSGKKTVVEKDEESGETKVKISKPLTVTTKWAADAGDRLSARDQNFIFFKRMGGDTAWFTTLDDGEIEITEDVSFELKVTRPKKAEVAEKQSVNAAPAKKRSRKAAEPEPVAEEPEPELDLGEADQPEHGHDDFLEETSDGIDPDLEIASNEL